MGSRRARSPDALARLFLEVTGELPGDASLLRMRRVSGALSLRDNDALWSMIVVLEYYTRLYEAMPDRIRRAGDVSFDAVCREAEAATDALMRQHRDALARCKATIQLAESMIREHEAKYQVALATLNEESIAALANGMSNRVAKIAGNRFVGAAAVAARDQRKRMDAALGLFEQAIADAVKRVQTDIEETDRRLIRTLNRLFVVAVGLFVTLVAAAFWMGEHAR
ncbi:hypothetical protein WL88_25435 [Burkholderia diffusa]|uniref:Chemotaxis protein n=1 Tax=Burkholderia diffusa TaxID=488732 RepID=A0AAW3P9H0_9BURK|nr:hypothetical protein [Burkholderia diffusa]KWF32693.1 hypothetical protein WL86_29450 [Burkholderia diffusa]KWF38618.1 hypothetical protein WL85_10620 [Burkholderia diffusa]KWF46663.1 hypothetical protein WL88_25435 [Burkholderia diffusa]KWF50763.1 hypothetical protein WL87_16480 [Burkholderia diffusa]